MKTADFQNFICSPKIRLFAVLFFTFLLIGCAVEQETLVSNEPVKKTRILHPIENLSGSGDSKYRLDEKKISGLVKKISAGNFGNIDSLIIIQNDKLILEKYFRGWERDKLHACFSVTKSVTSALIGIAIEKGLIKDVDLKLTDIFTDYQELENMSEKKKSITLENVLTMTVGYRWNELSVPYKNDDGSWNTENDIVKLHINAKDFIKYVLDLPLINDPGEKFTYNTGCSILLSGIIEKETGKSAEEFAAENLFTPLGIKKWRWSKSPNGTTDTGGGLFLHPADMAMFGYLFLKHGKMNGVQIIQEDWIRKSTARHIEIPGKGEYGYQWWRFKKSTKNKSSDMINSSYYAVGIGGQTIFVVPDADLVVVSTADNLLHKGKNIFSAFFEQIIPSLMFI